MKRFALSYWAAVALIFFAGFLYWLIDWSGEAYTNDAYVGGNQVYITPLHPGFTTSIHTDDTYLVKKGELLVQLDETDAQISFDAAKENLAQTVRDVCQLFHQVFVYRADIEARKAEFIKNAQDFQHRLAVIGASGVSLEDYEHAVAGLRSSFYALKGVEELYEKALAAVQGTSLREHPLVLQAADKMRDAWVFLYRCKIRSPVEGLAAQRTIQVGMWVKAGDPLLSVIPLDQIWVNANFKETQLRHMRIGQKVRVTTDLYGDGVVFHGRIAGLPGVAGNAVSLLPPQNLSGNWIKIVQRLPVRVELKPEEVRRHPLRIGLSCEAKVDLGYHGLLVPESSAGSPLYDTAIFEKEEIGDQEFIDGVIGQNLDPSLIEFSEELLPFATSMPLALPSEIESALFENSLEPPLVAAEKTVEKEVAQPWDSEAVEAADIAESELDKWERAARAAAKDAEQKFAEWNIDGRP